MSWSTCRAAVVLTLVAFLAGLATVGHTFAQRQPIAKVEFQPPGFEEFPVKPGQPKKKENIYDLGSLKLPKDEEELKTTFDLIEDQVKLAIKAGREGKIDEAGGYWVKACSELQRQVGRPSDRWVPRDRKNAFGQPQVLYVSVKKEAGSIIGTLPEDGRKVYETLFGPKAVVMVKRAKTNDDFREMALAASIYLYTDAGADAVNWLGTYLLNRADYQAAAKWYRLLLERGPARDVKSEKALLKAAYAFHLSGEKTDKVLKEQVFKELARRGVSVRLREENLNPEELIAAIDKMPAFLTQANSSNVQMFGASLERCALQAGGPAYLDPLWIKKIIGHEETRRHILEAETTLGQVARSAYPAGHPITVTSLDKAGRTNTLVVYRNTSGIAAVDLKTGKYAWESESEWSLDRVFGDKTSATKASAYRTWINAWKPSTSRPQMLLENTLLGTLSSDGKMVFGIDDIPVPPQAHMVGLPDPRFGGPMPQQFGKEVTEAINHNRLFALDLNKDGYLRWELGGMEDKDKLPGYYFLGAPLPVNNQLYVLAEKQQELLLLTLDPSNGKLLNKQHLADVKDVKLSQDPLRRVQAAHLSYGGGVLVIPTNAGALFAYDVHAGSLLWAYPYAESDKVATPPAGWQPFNPVPGWIAGPNGRPVKVNTDSTWQVTAPVIHNGKVIFTAPDASRLHCVNLRDGLHIWSVQRQQDDLFLGGAFQDKVVVVGKKRTRGLDLVTGTLQWELECGHPSGQGAASTLPGTGDIGYYLPIRSVAQGKDGEPEKDAEICTINVSKGYIHAHTRSRGNRTLGNLVFFEGKLLAQSGQEIVVFPPIETKIVQIDEKLRNAPEDPTLLVERGEYLLDKGDLTGSIGDFRTALRGKISDGLRSRARSKLYEAFTEYFQRNFTGAETYLREFEDVCKVETTGLTGAQLSKAESDTRKQRAKFLTLMGKGREAQGKFVDAFDKYLELGEAGREPIQVVEEPSLLASPDVWAQGRIRALIASIRDEDQKKEIENRIIARWDKLKASSTTPIPDLKRFVALFGNLFDVGKQARLALAERLMNDTDINSLLEAEQQLTILRSDPEKLETAALAVEALARLNTKKGLLEDAAYYYRLLGERYSKIQVAGKPGEEYLDDLATDKRFLPYLEQAGRYVIKGRMDIKGEKDSRESHPFSSLHYHFAHDGEQLPFFAKSKVALQMSFPQRLKLWETSVNEPRWSLDLPANNFQNIIQDWRLHNPNQNFGFPGGIQNQPSVRLRCNYQTIGHLVVLQLGNMVFGIDPLNKGRVLWEKNLSLKGDQYPAYQSLEIDNKDNTVRVLYNEGWTQRLGGTGPLQGGVICLQMRDALTAIDPVSGRTLWTRSDVGSGAHLFGDDRHIYVVAMTDAGQPGGTRVLRAQDGVSVRARDFSDEYSKRRRVSGRNILASETNARNEVTLRLWDCLAGKNVWSETFPVSSVVLQSEDAQLSGVVTPQGEVKVIDAQTRQVVLDRKIDIQSHYAKATAAFLVTDPDYLFVVINHAANNPAGALGAVAGSVQANVHNNAGFRSIPVNGFVYAYRRSDARLMWWSEVNNQHLLLTQFSDLPALVFASRYYNPAGLNRGMLTYYSDFKAIAKHNGKMCYDERIENQQMSPVHTVAMNHRTGQIEVVSDRRRFTLTPVPR